MTLSLDWLALGSLSGHGVLMLAFATVTFAIFVWDRFDLSSVSLSILIVLPALFFVFPLDGIEPRRFFAGFGHPALVTICALMILGHALVLTGALGPAARQLAWLMGHAPRLAIGVVLVGAAAASGVMNNTPVAVLLIPLLMAAMRRAGRAPGQVLMPMNGALLLGGMTTTIGTSTNLIVVAIASSMGVAAFGIFDFFVLVATASVPALLYLWFVAPLLLRHVSPSVVQEAQPVFEAELLVTEESWLNGAEVREVVKRAGAQLPLRSIRRAKGIIVPPLATAKLHLGDRLIVQDTAENLKEYESRLKAPLHAFEDDPDSDDAHAQAVAAQLVVTPDSPLVGSTVRVERLANKYQLVVIGLRKAQGGANVQRTGLADLRISEGDVLLVQGPSESLQTAQRDGIGLLLDEQLALPRQRHSVPALLTLTGVIAAAGLGGVPIELAAMLGVLVLLTTRCLAWHDIAAGLSVKVVLLVAASLALGDALAITGGTVFLASAFTHVVSGWSGGWVLAALMGVMGLLTNFVSNNAAAAIGTPLAVEIARTLGLPPEPFVLAVLFGCNLCFLTPMAYQTNLLVMNAGGYSFGDFVRMGVPLFVIMWIGLSILLAMRYGL